jgi:glycosyltransferase involved in cell wall biosynthesis
VDALAGAVAELIRDADALAGARAGAQRAREELTWDAAAAAHLELYRELLP